jgi:protein-tyrosine phosphatase
MAEAIFNSHADTNAVSESFGIYANNGEEISEHAKNALREIGIESVHTAKQISEDEIKHADMVFGITSSHAAMLCSLFPEYSEKIYSFPIDIPDPFGSDIEVYRKCRDEIANGVELITGYLSKNEK